MSDEYLSRQQWRATPWARPQKGEDADLAKLILRYGGLYPMVRYPIVRDRTLCCVSFWRKDRWYRIGTALMRADVPTGDLMAQARRQLYCTLKGVLAAADKPGSASRLLEPLEAPPELAAELERIRQLGE